MKFVTKESSQFFAKNEAGGKGFSLYKLSSIDSEGFSVPDWFCVGLSFFDQICKENKIDTEIAETLKNLSKENTKETSQKIEQLILSLKLSEGFKKILELNIKELNCDYVAVRSSAADEDSPKFSFAGQLSSFLFIKGVDEVILALKKCWASAYSERSLFYRLENKLDFEVIQIAVVIQQMISPQVSGVVFSANPLSKDANEILINSVFGLGEALVSGQVDGDTYLYDQNENKIKEQELAEKNMAMEFDFDNKTLIERKLDNDQSKESTLSTKQVKDLSKIAKEIEKFMNYYQDIEWCLVDEQFYVVQSRPITTQIFNQDGKLYIWDNSNIVESYGGITLPLTFGFARYVYRQVYVQFCEVLLVPTKHIKEMDYFLSNMLGIFYGRIYYNLLNWYKLTSILPGYKYNRSFMETMMGTNEALQDEIAQRVRPPSFQQTLGAKFRLIITGLKFLYFHFTIQSIVDNFLKYFNTKYKEFKKIDYFKLKADEIYDHYQELEKTMLWKWHAPIINDYICMVHYGIFKALTGKWLSHLGDNFFNDLLAGNGNLESAMPTKRLIELANIVTNDPDLKNLILNNKPEHLLDLIEKSHFRDFNEQVVRYLDLYGYRCMSEMKLEQIDLSLNPSLFFVFLKNLINAGQTDLQAFEQREKEIRDNAEIQLNKNLSGIKLIIYSWSLKHARKAVMNRENTRFCRTRVYGIVRRMFYAMGEDYALTGLIEAKEDIFYLSLEELKGSLEGTCPIVNLKALIETRKKEYNQYEETEDPLTRFHTRGPMYVNNILFEADLPNKVEIDTSNLKENQMAGIACSPGIIEGVVKVITGPEDDLTMNGEILVAKRTDPGWIPLYPSSSGLLIERGGLLSHSAIVAREMGLPTIVSIKNLTKKLKTGDRVRFDGTTGIIDILE